MALKKVILFIIAFCLLNINKVKSAGVTTSDDQTAAASEVPLPDSGEPSDDQRIAAFPMTPYATEHDLKGNHPKAEKIGQAQVQTKLNQIDVTVWTEPGSLPSKFCREKLNIEDFIDLLDANDLIEIIEHYKNEIPEEVKRIIIEQTESSIHTNITRPTLIQTENGSLIPIQSGTKVDASNGTKHTSLISAESASLLTPNRPKKPNTGTVGTATDKPGTTSDASAGTESLLTPTDLQQTESNIHTNITRPTLIQTENASLIPIQSGPPLQQLTAKTALEQNESTSFSPYTAGVGQRPQLIQTKADASTGTEHTSLILDESGSLLTPNRPNRPNINDLPQDVNQKIVKEDPEDCPPTDSQKCKNIIILLDIKPDLIKQRIKAAIEKQRDQQGHEQPQEEQKRILDDNHEELPQCVPLGSKPRKKADGSLDDSSCCPDPINGEVEIGDDDLCGYCRGISPTKKKSQARPCVLLY